MRTSSLVAVFTLALGSIHCSESSKSTTTEVTPEDSPQPVVLKSHVDKGDPSVVLLSSNSITCTGTVIAPTYVLTATHCVSANGDLRSHPMRINGIKVVRYHVPENAIEETDEHHFQHDVAVLELAKPISIAAIPINFDASALEGIDAIRTVGYGRTGTDNDDSGVKRNGTARVTHSRNFLASIPGTGGICYGDSGGPALAEIDGKETIIGVSSYVSQHECESARGMFVRTDRQKEFLSKFVDASSTPPPDRIARRDPPPPVAPEVTPEEPSAPNPPHMPNPRAHRHHHSRYDAWPRMNDAQTMIDNGDVRVTIDEDGTLIVVQQGRIIRAGSNGVQID